MGRSQAGSHVKASELLWERPQSDAVKLALMSKRLVVSERVYVHRV